MFERYLESEAVYRDFERHFVAFFFLKLAQGGKLREDFATPVYNTRFANGVPFMDGNPIFSAKNKRSGATLRVVIDDGDGFSSYDERKDSGVECVIIGDIKYLADIEKAFSEWVDQQ
ncbi:hypothetical protein [Pseudomonas purpurea]|uniref:hypothetical protein n=1 Tax=Pseudomonas purpurea TaxID=3136737 RepID=UPI003263E8D5